MLYERLASHNRGLNFVRLGTQNGGNARKVTSRVAGIHIIYTTLCITHNLESSL